ncbi:MAG: DUF4388 domain-containing protein [Candidatus Eisenbacteria bacterium]|nr:DUF4388 domain-containing protein [Candidatus Eisenbacteria bacterium]
MASRSPMRCAAPLLWGRLDAFAPLELLQWMAHHRGDVELMLSGAGAIALHCRDGRLRGIRSRTPLPGGADSQTDRWAPDPDRLGGRLVRQGGLTPPRLRFALALQRLARPERRRLGGLLRASGFVSPQRLDEALRRQAAERLAAALRWETGWFVVRGARRPLASDLVLDEPLERLLLRLVRQLDLQAPHQGSGNGGSCAAAPRASTPRSRAKARR